MSTVNQVNKAKSVENQHFQKEVEAAAEQMGRLGEIFKTKDRYVAKNDSNLSRDIHRTRPQGLLSWFRK